MRTDHIDRAVRETCPFGRQTCCLAVLGGCAAVNDWTFNHKAQAEYTYYISPQEVDHVNGNGTHHGNKKDHLVKTPRWAFRG